jgi:hypothetical protein
MGTAQAGIARLSPPEAAGQPARRQRAARLRSPWGGPMAGTGPCRNSGEPARAGVIGSARSQAARWRGRARSGRLPRRPRASGARPSRQSDGVPGRGMPVPTWMICRIAGCPDQEAHRPLQGGMVAPCAVARVRRGPWHLADGVPADRAVVLATQERVIHARRVQRARIDLRGGETRFHRVLPARRKMTPPTVPSTLPPGKTTNADAPGQPPTRDHQ